jgi:hypothetical protein
MLATHGGHGAGTDAGLPHHVRQLVREQAASAGGAGTVLAGAEHDAATDGEGAGAKLAGNPPGLPKPGSGLRRISINPGAGFRLLRLAERRDPILPLLVYRSGYYARKYH